LLQGIIAANYPDYPAKAWQLTLIIFATLISGGLMNMYAWFLIPWLELLSGILHILLFIIFVVVFVTIAPRHSAEWVFLHQESSSGWMNKFVSFNLAMWAPSWGFVGEWLPDHVCIAPSNVHQGFDGTVHLSEEVRMSRLAVPRALFWSIALNAVLAYAIILVFLFCMGDITAAADAVSPVVEICRQATGSLPAATALATGLLIVGFAATFGSVASASRITWAWARDGGLPAWFALIDPTHRIPIRSIWLPIFLVMCLTCLNIASSAAFGAITSLASLALYISYGIAISCMLRARILHRVQYGEWVLGKLGIPINIYALLYTGWMAVFFCFPEYLPATGPTFNYALPIFVLVVLFALLLWFLQARVHWPGLNKEVIDIVLADANRNSKD
jgi:choline transport protein